MRMMGVAWWLWVCCGWAAAQSGVPAAEEILPKIYDYAEHYRATLPSLSCDESITSQEVRKGKVKKQVKVESTLREVRTGAANEFEEKHDFRTVDGEPLRGKFKAPYYVTGGFANAIGFADRSKMGCYEYRVFEVEGRAGSLRLEIAGRPDWNGCSSLPEGYRKTAVVDRETGRIEHVERTISAEAAKQMKETYFASMDYGLQAIGDETLWLPIRMTSHDDRDEGRMAVVYTKYHRYLGSATILPEVMKGAVE